MIVVIKNIGLP